MEDLKLQIVGHMIFYLKSLSYCPKSWGSENGKADQWEAYLFK